MAGLDRHRLVLITAVVSAPGGDTLSLGTGYLVAPDLVLTASHVLPLDGVTAVEVRVEDGGGKADAHPQPVWRDAPHDAMLLRLKQPLDQPGPPPDWLDTFLDADADWQSSGYPAAANAEEQGRLISKTVGLSGRLQALGGQGEGERELDLVVAGASSPEGWAGVSGAPVFVGGRLAGLIKEVPLGFSGGRLAGVPAATLLLDHGFRLALATPWLDPLPTGAWVLVLECEAQRGRAGLAEWVDGALSSDKTRKALEAGIGGPLRPKALRVPIEEALATPGRWLQFVRALCAAPIAVVDATGFEPAVMLALGVRAVVRRGVTLTSTADLLGTEQLSKLPFNIQETRLLHHGDGYLPQDTRHPLVAIPAAILRGWQELEAQPSYLDLPAYDAVRCPYPATDADGRSAVARMLVLCPFGESYAPNWLALSNALLRHYPASEVARMLDITSPRLVGQALYEGIRWAKTCIADWTGWRPNVFFELGVRLACADFGPVALIAQTDLAASAAKGAKAQHGLLVRLFQPQGYSLAARPKQRGAKAAAMGAVENAADAIDCALHGHDAVVARAVAAAPLDALPHDATFRTCRDHFDWRQEHITTLPHDWLRSSIEAPFGKDPQADGRMPLLFSANPAYSRDLDHSIKERWIAAWYYLSQRYPRSQWAEDGALREGLRKLGNDVLLSGLATPTEIHLVALRKQVQATLAELDDLDVRSMAASPDAGRPLDRIRSLKTSAKNWRAQGITYYPRALAALRDAIRIAEGELAPGGTAEQRGQAAAELSDCHGQIGGLERRWGDELGGAHGREHLLQALRAYDAAFVFEGDPQYGIVNSYALVNRLVLRLLLAPAALGDRQPLALADDIDTLALGPALKAAAATVRRQIAGPRHGDYWALADLAQLELLCGQRTAAAAYAGFLALSPPDFACNSVLAGLQPLATLHIAPAPQLQMAMALVQARLDALGH